MGAESIEDGSPRSGRSTQQVVRWTVFLAATVFVVYLCLLVLGPFVNVLAWSSVLTIAFYPLHIALVRATGRASLSAFLCSLLVVVLILVPLLSLTAISIDQSLALRAYFQQRFSAGFDLQAVAPLQTIYEWLVRRFGIDATGAAAWLTQHADELGAAMAGYSLAFLTSVSGAIGTFLFTIFAMFLLFRDGAQIVEWIIALFPFERRRSVAMLSRIRDVIYASVYGVVVIGVLQGLLTGLMFWILNSPSAALWGAVAAITGALPLLGAAAVWVPGVVYLAVTGHWTQAIVLAIWGTAVVSMVDNFLRPRLVGDRVGLNELVMFFALLGGLQVFGLLGIVLGPVVFAVAGSILDVLSRDEAAASESA